MVDYKRFLGKREELVLPHLGGAFVETGTRRLRVDGSPPVGWTRFEVSGRRATALGPADAPDLGELPSRTGHFVAGYLATDDGKCSRLSLVPDDEPLVLCPVRGRAWHDGSLLFAEVLFEGEAEEATRRRLEDDRPIGDLKGVSASLRTAFAHAMTLRVARRLGVSASPVEVRAAVRAVAERGIEAAEEAVRALVARREESAREVLARRAAERGRGIAERILARAPRGRAPTLDDAEERATAALAAASGRLLSSRRVGSELEVRYEIFGERFVTLVDALSLHVVDAGVCLDGADEELTLESLPSVIREAIETGQLVITQR